MLRPGGPARTARGCRPPLGCAERGRRTGRPVGHSPAEPGQFEAESRTLTDEARRSRLAACASETCRMLCLDSGGGRPRKWCSMRRCGNRAKAAGHRLRASAAGRTS
ncbi:CGNR zinc finger domain-containing protein [Streptomyces violaceorubidus]